VTLIPWFFASPSIHAEERRNERTCCFSWVYDCAHWALSCAVVGAFCPLGSLAGIAFFRFAMHAV